MRLDYEAPSLYVTSIALCWVSFNNTLLIHEATIDGTLNASDYHSFNKQTSKYSYQKDVTKSNYLAQYTATAQSRFRSFGR